MARVRAPGQPLPAVSAVLGILPVLRGAGEGDGVRIRGAKVISLLYRAADALRRRALRADHGRIGEDLAHRYLRRQGCTVVARNYRPPYGGVEIDLVAWHGNTLVFVVGKTRGAGRLGDAWE